MNVKFKFNLPKDQPYYDIYNQSNKTYQTILGFMEYLRTKLKYSELSEAELDIYEKVSDDFYEILNNNEVNTDI